MSDKYPDKYVAKLDPGYRMSMIGNRKQDSLPIVFLSRAQIFRYLFLRMRR